MKKSLTQKFDLILKSSSKTCHFFAFMFVRNEYLLENKNGVAKTQQLHQQTYNMSRNERFQSTKDQKQQTQKTYSFL